MKKFALIGNPISHSKSPELFRKAFPGSGLSYDLVERDTVEQSIACLKEKGYGGANVTAPFKESAMQFVTDPDPVSKALGATNLILFRNDKVFSYNTDYLAVRRMVRELRTRLCKSDYTAAAVIGCGGAGKAAALACLDEGLHTFISNRTMKKAEDFARNISGYHYELETISIAEADSMLKNADGSLLVIYTIPVPDGVLSEVLKSCSQAGQEPTCNNPDSRITVIEANYKNPCLNPESGIRWLKYQAVESFRLMTGIAPYESRF